MATNYPTALDTSAYLNSLLALRHDPAQLNNLLQGLVDAVVALQTKVGTTSGGFGTNLVISDNTLQVPRGTAAGAVAAGFGTTANEGLQIYVVEETISFAANAELYKALTFVATANTVILSAQANIESALTGGSTTVKLGLGTEADPDAYGLSSALTKNTKITTVPDWAVISSSTPLRLSSCASNGAAGDTALTVGSVRVRLVVLTAANLANAV